MDVEVYRPHFDQPDKRSGGTDDFPFGSQLRPGPGCGIDGGLIYCGNYVSDRDVHVPSGGGVVRPDEPQAAANVHRVALRPVFARPCLRHHHSIFGVPAGGHRCVLHYQFRVDHRLRQRVYPPGPYGGGLGLLWPSDAPGTGGGPGPRLALRDAVGFGAAFVAACISTILSFVCVTILPYDAKAPQEGEKKHSLKLNDLFAVEFLSLMLLATLFSSANGLATTYLDILATERGIPNISLFFTAYAVALVIVKPITGRLQDKKGLYFVMIPAVVFAALGTFLVGVAYSLAMMMLAAVCRALGQGAGTPCLQAHTVRTLDASKAGVAVSTIVIGQNLGNALAPIGGSFFAESFGYEGMFCGMGVATLFIGMFLLVWNCLREKKAGLQ